MNKELEDLKIELMLNGKAQYFYNIEDFFVHMFIPQKNGEGYHSEYIIEGVNELTIIKKYKNGVYSAKLDNKSGVCTFFPRIMKPKEIIDACIEAFNNRINEKNVNGYVGKCNSGIFILFKLKGNKILGAYPYYKQDKNDF